MDDFNKNYSTPTSIKSSLRNRSPQSDSKQRSCLSKEHNENEAPTHHNQMSSTSKKSITKHFMSPTVSAEAKKRILVEKNESPCEEDDLGFLRYPLSPLNPRPMFRLYNPNKRAEILRRQERRGRVGLIESQLFCGRCTSSAQEKSSQEQEPRNDFEEDEELEEGKDGVLLKVFKFLLVLSALFLTTLYISSMNSTAIPASSIEPHWGLNEGPSKIKDSQVSVNDFVWGSMSLKLTQESESSLKGATEKVASEGVVKDDVIEQDHKKPNVVSEGDTAIESLDLSQASEIHVLPNSIDYTDKLMMSCGSNQLSADNVATDEGTGKDEVVEHDVPNLSNTLDEVVFEYEVENVKPMISWVSNQLSVEHVTTSEGTGEDEGVEQEVENVVNNLDEVVVEDEVENVVMDEVVEQEVANIGNLDEVDVENEVENMVMDDMGVMPTPQGRDIVDNTESLGVPGKSDSFSCKIDEKKIILGKILSTCEIDADSSSGASDQAEKFESTVAEDVVAIVGITLLAGTIGFLYRKFKRLLKGDTSPLIQPYVESIALEEDRGLSFAEKNECTEKNEQFVKAEYDVHPPASVHFEEQISTELHGSRVSTVQLLGEYEVLAPFNRCAVNMCSREPIPVDTPQRKQGISSSRPSLGEYEVLAPFNRCAVNMCSREPIPVDTPQRKQGISSSRPSLSQFCSTTESSSNGKLTHQGKMLRNEVESGGQELAKVSTTVLRRSSRLRNKTVMSLQM